MLFGAVLQLLLVGLIFWGWRKERRLLCTLRRQGYQTTGIVREYSQPNALTPDSYPYVEYTDVQGTTRLQRLEYVKKKDDQPLSIGQTIDVVSYRSHLYYLTALEQNIRLRVSGMVIGLLLALWLLHGALVDGR